MRKNIEAKEIVKPAITRFATNFLKLQSLLSQAQKLRKIVFAYEWNASLWSHKTNGKDIKKKYFANNF